MLTYTKCNCHFILTYTSRKQRKKLASQTSTSFFDIQISVNIHQIWWQSNCHWPWCNLLTALKSYVLFDCIDSKKNTRNNNNNNRYKCSRFISREILVSNRVRRKLQCSLHQNRWQLTFRVNNYLYNVWPCSKFHMHFQISSQISCLGSELAVSF